MNKKDKLTIKEDLYRLTTLSGLLFVIWLFQKFQLDYIKQIFYTVFNHYDYFNPPVFLSIGEAIAAIAILLAIFQFKKDDWEIALEIRKNTKPIAFFFLALSLFCIFFSSLVSFTFLEPSNLFHISSFWQILSGIFILTAFIWLFFRARNKNLFNNRTKKLFGQVLLRKY